MKRLFGRGAGSSSAKREGSAGPLTNKTVQVGPHMVLVEHVLGLGGYGEIYRAVDVSSGQRFALKHLRLDRENMREVQGEAKTMARLRGHPNILRLHAVAFAGPKGAETDGFFLLDYCPGTLLDLMSRHNYVLEGHTILHIFASVCHAVAAMHHHQPPLAHRDIKAENVLMLPDGTWVVCDYGSATSRAQVYDTPAAIAAEEEVIAKHTTPAYRPPEMWDLQLMRKPIDTKVDIWALGVLLYVLCYGRLPFTGDSKLQIINGKYDLPATSGSNAPSRPQQLVSLIAALLQVEPSRRPTIDEVLAELDGAALAITGRGILGQQAGAGPGTAAPAPAPAPPAQDAPQAAAGQQPQQEDMQRFVQQQRMLQQQKQQQELLQRMQAAKQQAALQQQQQQQQPSSSAGGAFWGSSTTAAAAYGTAPAASDNGSASATPTHQQQHQQGLAGAADDAPDWARFTSPPPSFSGSVSAAAAAGAAGQGKETLSVSGKDAAHATAAAAAVAGGAGAADVPVVDQGRSAARTGRGDASGAASTKRAPPPPPPAVPEQAGAQGAAPPVTPSSASQGVRAHAVNIPASPHSSPVKGTRGGAGSSAAAAPDAAPGPDGGAGGSGVAPNGNPFAGSRQARSSGSGGSPTSQHQQQQQQQQQPDMSRLQDIKARAAGIVASRAAAPPPASGEDDRLLPAKERQPQPYSMVSASSGSSSGGVRAPGQQASGSFTSRAAPAASAATAAAAAAAAAAPQQQQQRARADNISSGGSGSHGGARPAGHTPAAPAAVSVSDSAGMAAVLSELIQLRAQVSGLAEQNQAFVIRIKQLEEYTVQQQAAMGRLVQQVERLQQQQQQSSSSLGHGGGGGSAAMQEAPAVDGGSWLHRHMSRRASSDSAGAAGAAEAPVSRPGVML